SGLVKLLSGDEAWRGLTALRFHYETQPLPTPLGWWAHQMPGWFQTLSAASMFAIELGAPFLVFAPRRARILAGAVLLALQPLTAATGTYRFFTLLPVALCLRLLADAALPRPRREGPPASGPSWPRFVMWPVAVALGLASLGELFGTAGIGLGPITSLDR